jgi:hypothetical protein
MVVRPARTSGPADWPTVKEDLTVDQIVQEVVQRTGLSEDQARSATQVVIEQLQQRAPEPMKGMLSQYMGGGGEGGTVGQATDAARNLFNR